MKVKDILEFLKDKDPEIEILIENDSFCNEGEQFGEYSDFNISECRKIVRSKGGFIIKELESLIVINGWK